MTGQAAHFAITDNELNALLNYRQGGDIIYYIKNVFEERWLWGEDDEFACDTTTTWEPIHDCLDFVNAPYPLRLCICGGVQLYTGNDYIVSLVDNSDLQGLVSALDKITPDFLEDRCSIVDAENPDHWEYTLDSFSDLCGFFSQALEAEKNVVFVAGL